MQASNIRFEAERVTLNNATGWAVNVWTKEQGAFVFAGQFFSGEQSKGEAVMDVTRRLGLDKDGKSQ